jgi:3-oxoacyl-[acyl-carrier protein] reductase
MTCEPAPSPHGYHQRDTYPDLAQKVAAVTGGSRVIGAATAWALAANGTAVTVVGRDHAAIDATVQGISAEGGTALGVAADCTVESDLAALHRTVADDLGPVDILAAFAGGNGVPVSTGAERGEHWREVIETDLTGEFANVGIRVNCLAPSAIENDHMRSWVPAEQRKELAAAFPLGRLGQPEDVAAAALFLASSASSWRPPSSPGSTAPSYPTSTTPAHRPCAAPLTTGT